MCIGTRCDYHCSCMKWSKKLNILDIKKKKLNILSIQLELTLIFINVAV